MQENGPPCSDAIVLCSYCGQQFVSSRSVSLHLERSKKCNRLTRINDEQNLIRADGGHNHMIDNLAMHVQMDVSDVPQFAIGGLSRYRSSLSNHDKSYLKSQPKQKMMKKNKDDVAGSYMKHQSHDSKKHGNIHELDKIPKHVIDGLDYLMKELRFNHLLSNGEKISQKDLLEGVYALPSFNELKLELTNALKSRGKLLNSDTVTKDGLEKSHQPVRNNLIFDVQCGKDGFLDGYDNPLLTISALTEQDVEAYIGQHVDDTLLFDSSSESSSQTLEDND